MTNQTMALVEPPADWNVGEVYAVGSLPCPVCKGRGQWKDESNPSKSYWPASHFCVYCRATGRVRRYPFIVDKQRYVAL